ncbi:hypothetical protein M408DRAFT_230473, partial [Serendipita vermifera MAFF 305830]
PTRRPPYKVCIPKDIPASPQTSTPTFVFFPKTFKIIIIMSWPRRSSKPSSSSNNDDNDRTVSVSEFISFLFRSQLVEAPTNDTNPELQGLSGMMLRTFSESPRDEDSSAYIYSDRSTLNRSRFDSSRDTGFERANSTTSSVPSSPVSQSSGMSGSGWRMYGHSRQASTSSTDSSLSTK